MIIKKVKINIYRWEILLIEIESRKDHKKVRKILTKFGVSEEYIKDTIDNIKKGIRGHGHHTGNPDNFKSLICLYRKKSDKQRNRTLSHEMRHCEDVILKTMGIKDDESAAYLSGYLGKKLL